MVMLQILHPLELYQELSVHTEKISLELSPSANQISLKVKGPEFKVDLGMTWADNKIL